METIYLPYRQSKIECLKFGNGDHLLVAMHGFGDNARLFRHLAPSLSQKYTVYALSFPYHGDTQWKEGIFTQQDIEQIIRLVMQREQKTRITLMGYSMGGKITLTMIPKFADELDKVYLLAPDGILTHQLYDVISTPRWLVRIIKFFMQIPPLFFAIVRIAFRLKLLSKFLHDFTFNHFYTKEQRLRFFRIYDSVHAFVPDLSHIQSLLNAREIPVEMFYGIRDEVIPVKGGEQFAAPLLCATLHVMDKGHLLVDQDLDALLAKTLYDACV